MLVGNCMRCGKRYVGWALSRPEHQVCLECGATLVVRNMSENYQPHLKKTISAQRSGSIELQEALEEKPPHLLL